MISFDTTTADKKTTDNQSAEVDDDLGLFDPPVEAVAATEEADKAAEANAAEADDSERSPKRVRMIVDVEIPDDGVSTPNGDGDGVLELKIGQEFDVEPDTFGKYKELNVLVDGVGIMIEDGEYEVIEWFGVEGDVAAEEAEVEETTSEVGEGESAELADPESPVEVSPESPAPSEPATNYQQAVTDFIDNLKRQELLCEEAESEVNSLKEQLKESKKIYDGHVATLRRMVNRPVERMPLFDGPDKPAAEKSGGEADESTESTVEPVAASEEAEGESVSQGGEESDGWRSVSIDDLGLPPSLAEKLRENPGKTIATVGDLSDWTSKFQITDIKGVGDKKAEVVESALDSFWEDHPEFVK